MEDDFSLMDCVVSEDTPIQQIIELKELKKVLYDNLSKLTDDEVKVLHYRYGLEMKLREIAELMECSSQNVSRLERKALNKLKKVKSLRKIYYA